MPNPYFRFKRFTVYHDKGAMKVGTDGVLLGAWADTDHAKTALDIGTGTGLIALMMAQRAPSLYIDAIDIDNAATEQAKDNIANSPFAAQIECRNVSLQELAKTSKRKYDIIVSNPPYFIESLKSPDQQRTLARHTDQLPIEELICLASGLLSENGHLSIVFPYEHKDLLTNLADENNLFVSRITNVYPTPESQPKRVLMEFGRRKMSVKEDNLTIEIERHKYSDEFTELAKDFYLKL